MSGRHSGVAARIKAKTNHAFYVHCNAHCLNLVLVDSTKSVPESNLLFFATEIVCVHGSLCKRKCIKVPQEIYKGSVTPGGHVGTRLAKTLRTDCLLYCVCYMILMWRTEENALWRHGVYLPNWILPLSDHLSSFQKSMERQIPCRHASVNVS